MAEKSNWSQNNQAIDACRVYKNCTLDRYIQPPRPKSIKPVSQYQSSGGPMESETIYKNSYLPVGPCSVDQPRTAPIIPEDRIHKNTGGLGKESVSRLSYPGHHSVEPPKPILPAKLERNLIADGSFCSETTQKCDFEPKYSRKRDLILPVERIQGARGVMEQETTNTLSFRPINVLVTPPPKPLKPVDHHEAPNTPIDSDTIHKLSFIPHYPSAKEECPRDKKNPFYKDNVQENIASTYQTSFLNNRNKRDIHQSPKPCLMLGDGQFFDDRTSYKTTYVEKCVSRPFPIKDVSKIQSPNAPLECNTSYNMSFPGHCNKPRSMPILQFGSSLNFTGLFTGDTTNKISFPCCYQPRREPKIPKDRIMRASGSFEKNSLARMSYLPIDVSNFERTKPFKPTTYKPEGLTSYETTQKLSFRPVGAQTRQRPIVPRSSLRQPDGLLCAETTQRTSFMPPGKCVCVD